MQVQEFAGERTSLIPRGRNVHVRNDCFVRTNHFIKCSVEFVDTRLPLCRFWRFRFMRLLFAVHFLLTLPCFLTWLYACIACLLTTLWLLFFLQHIYVLLFTLPLVMKQPVVSAQVDLNAFYEIQVEQIQGAYLQARRQGIGVLATSRASINFQVFNRKGYQIMLDTKHWSRVMVVFTFILFVWSLSWALAETAAPLIVKNMNSTSLHTPCGFMFAVAC